MRFILFSIAVGLCAAPLRAELPELLNEACMKVSRDTERWAYTETTITTVQKGRSKGETVVHVDPSKPYAEQFIPIRINGNAPTERQLKQYRSKGERHGQELERRERQGRPEHPGEPPRVNINGATGALDLDHTTVVEENAQSITSEIPLHPDDQHRLPLEKLQLWLRVSKELHTLENVTIRVRSPFRVKVAAKINAGEFGMDFVSVDPQFAPPLTALHGDLAASMLFMKVSAKVEMKRTDFQRVKPYNDHFQVKVGPLQFISF